MIQKANYIINLSLVIVVSATILGLFANNILHIVKDTQSTEKRELAKCPTNYIEIKAHLQFEKCFEDNFSLRNAVVKKVSETKLEVFDKPTIGNISKGKNNWFYYNDQKYIDLVTGVRKYSTDEKIKIATALKDRKEFFEKNNIDYQMVVVPSKLSIYPEYFDRQIQTSKQTILEEYESIAKDVGFAMISFKTQLLNQKNVEEVFHPNDSHWNYNGMILEYQQLVQKFDLTPVQDLEKAKYDHRGDIPFVLNVFDSYVDKNADKYSVKNPTAKPETEQNISFELKNGKKIEYQKFTNSNKDLPKLVLFGDSFSDIMRPILAQSFSELYFYKTYKDFPKEELETIRPNKVIYVFNENQLLDIPE
jgi:SGNH hydrolase-like domain, acetyltransferase AlgX